MCGVFQGYVSFSLSGRRGECDSMLYTALVGLAGVVAVGASRLGVGLSPLPLAYI